ncbi:hypothetical protein F8388_008059 [Cannabis sativa]|uniref:peroxidase n=1 Tax=Cannabis sativa TaxID=3483 RepID=A0A7J6DXJ8_CANSA|nr:hypothetical protein F8388_008059 [Cannabis sativa]
MASQKVLLCFALQLIFVLSAFHHTANAQAQGLKVGFYANTCPKAETIVTQIIFQTMAVAPSLGAPLMRMHFHDCFVRGCEGSVLLNSATNQSEKFATPNLSLRGGHTIGTSHCTAFNNRLYNFTGNGDTDPSLDSEYIDKLKMKCKPADQTTLVEMDPGSFKTFDVEYFSLVAKRRGLFTSDAALLDDSETKAYVVNHATASGTATFFKDFGVSMVNMGRVGVLTGSAGQIRKYLDAVFLSSTSDSSVCIVIKMASQKVLICFALQLIFIFSVLHHTANAQGLKVGFYKNTCPKAEAIVAQITHDTVKVAPTLAAPLMRMHYHDCFVRGCEGSLLLNSATNQSEKFATPNLSLRGFQIIDKIKTALEKECPQVVSCADIVALVARDSVAALNGPTWEVETGRRDGRVSNITEALRQLVPPFANITALRTAFSTRGLSAKDIAVLSGAHTIGTSHCTAFNNRLYNFTGKGDTDPTLDSEYIDELKKKCKPADRTTLVEMDPGSFKTFDVKYFQVVAKRRGLFSSDSALLDDSETKTYVLSHASSSGTSSFFKDFGVSMVNMGRLGVLTGSAGEIRKVCSAVN